MRLLQPQPQDRSGIALIMVLIVMVVLGLLAGKFASSMKVETKLARNATYEAELEWMGRSGIELARYVLAVEGQGPAGQFDALNQKWAGGQGDTNGSLVEIDLSNYPIGRGSLAIKIVDQERKFNVNLASDAILRQALTLIGVDASLVSTIVDSIIDWRDTNKDRGLAGAESDEYEQRDPPYLCKDGPIDDISEMLLINGVTPAMFFGASGSGSRTVVFNRPPATQRSAFDEPVYAIGLVDLFTPLSGRLLNMNTASATALQVVPEIDENLARSIITARAGPDGAEGNEDDTPFRSVAELARVPGLNPAAAPLFQNYFTARSLVFEVHVTAQIDSAKREFIALLRRNNQRDIQVLSFYWK